jgi:hypothetical protein
LNPVGAVAAVIFSDGGIVVVLLLVVVAAVVGTVTAGMCTALPHAATANANPAAAKTRRTDSDVTP